MKLLKVGERFLNLDLLIEAAVGEDTALLTFASGRNQNMYTILLARSEAATVVAWLEANAEEAQILGED